MRSVKRSSWFDSARTMLGLNVNGLVQRRVLGASTSKVNQAARSASLQEVADRRVVQGADIYQSNPARGTLRAVRTERAQGKYPMWGVSVPGNGNVYVMAKYK